MDISMEKVGNKENKREQERSINNNFIWIWLGKIFYGSGSLYEGEFR